MAEPAFFGVWRSTRTAHRGTGVKRYGASAGAEGSNDIGAEGPRETWVGIIDISYHFDALVTTSML